MTPTGKGFILFWGDGIDTFILTFIKSINSDSKDIYNFTKDFHLKYMLFSDFLFIKGS